MYSRKLAFSKHFSTLILKIFRLRRAYLMFSLKSRLFHQKSLKSRVWGIDRGTPGWVSGLVSNGKSTSDLCLVSRYCRDLSPMGQVGILVRSSKKIACGAKLSLFPFRNRIFTSKIFRLRRKFASIYPLEIDFYIEKFSSAAQNCLDLTFRNRFYRKIFACGAKTEL